MKCDDCGRTNLTVTIVTTYGARYCRACVFPPSAKPKKGRGK